MKAEHLFEFIVPSDHPSLEGHFPGRPIVPAVVILDHVLTLLEQIDLPASSWQIKSTKFLSFLTPGERAQLHIDASTDQLHFTCRCGTTVIAKGILTRSNGEDRL